MGATGGAGKPRWGLGTAGTAGRWQAAPRCRRPHSTTPGSGSRPGRRGARMATARCQAGGPGTLGTGCPQPPPLLDSLLLLLLPPLPAAPLLRLSQHRSCRRCCRCCQRRRRRAPQPRLAGQQWLLQGTRVQRRHPRALRRRRRRAASAAPADGAACRGQKRRTHGQTISAIASGLQSKHQTRTASRWLGGRRQTGGGGSLRLPAVEGAGVLGVPQRLVAIQ